MLVTRIEKFSCGTVGKQTRKVIGDRREEKSEEKKSKKGREVKRRLELKMSDDHSDGEGSGY